MKHLEHDEQTLFFMMLRQLELDAVNLTFAVPNGMHTSSRHAKRMVDEGMRSGVPDILCAIPSKTAVGLAIEMKIPPNKNSPAQSRMQKLLAKHGWQVDVCTSGSMAFIVWAAYNTITEEQYGYVARKFGFDWYEREGNGR